MATKENISIVGGGLIGLHLALRLRETGAKVTVLEGASEIGGLAVSAKIGSYRWDRFYHVILLSDTHTRDLIRELGLESCLRWGKTRTGFYTGGMLYSLSDTVEFVQFPALKLFDKLRLAATIFSASRVRNWRRLERESSVDWLRRWSGKRVTEKIWIPLLRSKLGENYRIASAAFIWAIIARMYAARRTGLKCEMFGYLEGGYESLLRAMRNRLEELGVEIVTGARVDEVRQIDDDVVEIKCGDVRYRHDHAILTIPTPQVARICPQLSGIEKQQLESVVYQGIACASLLLREPLSDFYVTNITDSGIPFTGVIEMTSLVDRARFGGYALVYLPRYLAQDDPFWNCSDEEIEEQFVCGLERMYPAFRRDHVLAFTVSRARYVLALSTFEYSRRLLPPVVTSLRNVSLVNSAQIASGTLNVNETLAISKAGLQALGVGCG